jgi:hypothetical protein
MNEIDRQDIIEAGRGYLIGERRERRTEIVELEEQFADTLICPNCDAPVSSEYHFRLCF